MTVFVKVMVKVKFILEQGHEGPEVSIYIYGCTLPSTSALDGVGGQRHASAALPAGKTRYILYRRLGGPQVRFGRVRKISSPPRFDPRSVQPVASRYTDWVNLLTGNWLLSQEIMFAIRPQYASIVIAVESNNTNLLETEH